MRLTRFIRKLFFKFLVFLLSILLVTSVTLIFPLLVPIYLYRYLLSISIKIFRPDLSKILTTRSQIMACDNLYVKPRSTLIIFLNLEGDLESIEIEREYKMKNLVLLKDENGNLIRPEFQQYITRWMGFYFWKWDKNFKPENHFYEYNGPLKKDLYLPEDLHNIGRELVSKPFEKNKSPWEWVYVRNCSTDDNFTGTTGIFVRIHHSLADGFSILKLTTELISSEGTLEPMAPERPKRSLGQIIWDTIRFLIVSPFQLVECFLKSYDSNSWTVSENKLTSKLRGAIHPKVSIDFIKEIKTMHDISFTSVMLAAFTGGIRKYMIENKITVPNNIHCVYPLPMWGHPDKLRNFCTLCFLKLPIGQEDPFQRLSKIEKTMSKLKNSTVPLLLFYLCPFVGGLFPWMTNILSKQVLVTAVVSNFPGPMDSVKYTKKDVPIIDIIFLGGLLHGSCGFGLSAISYNGNLRIGAGLDEAFPITVPIRRLVDNIVNEFDVLYALGSV